LKKQESDEESLKKHIDELELNEKHFSLIYDTLSDAVYLLAVEPDDCFRFVSVNQAFLANTGLTREKVVGKRIEHVLPETAHTRVISKYKEAINENKTVFWKQASTFPTGELVGAVTVTPVCNDEGVCTHLVGTVHDLTENKQAMDALREKAYIIQSSSSVIATADLDGKMTYVNPSFFKVWGFEDDGDVLGRPFSKFWVVKDRLGEIMDALHRKRQWSDEIQARRQDGSLFDVQVSAAMVFDSQNKPIAYTSTSIDITERKRAEGQLRILSSVVEQSTSSIAIFDRQGIVEYVNPKVLELYEISPEEVVGKNWRSWMSIYSTLREKLPEMRNTILERGTTWKGEITDKSKRGEVIWKAATIFPIKDAKDEIVRIVYTSEDITERKKAEEALQESEERYRTIVESMHDLVFVIDKDNCITQYYATSEHLLYTSPDDFMGKHVKDVMPTDLSDEILKRLKEVRLTGHKGSLEYPLEIDGELFWFSSVLSLHDDGSSVVTVVRDITERKKTEEALRESEERYRSFVEKSNNYPGKICR
jgi:PAS domain S-box-containing protein